jgi:hypothetical protein
VRELLSRTWVVAVVVGFAVGPSPAAAGWEKPFALSAAAPNSPAGGGPDVAAAPDGSFVAAWFQPVSPLDDERDDRVIQARRVDPAGDPGPVMTLTPDAGAVGDVHVATGPTGDSVVIWQRQAPGGQDFAVEARRIAADGSLGPHLVVSEAGDGVVASAVAIDPAGDATVAWAAHPVGSGYKLKARRLPATGPPGPIVTVPNEDESFLTDLAIAVGPDRRPLVVFEQRGVIEAQRLSESGEPLPGITRLSPNDESSITPVVGMDGSGVAHVAWQRDRPGAWVNSTRTVAPDGTLGATEVLSDSERDSSLPEVAVNESGATAFAWEQLAAPDDPTLSVFGVVAQPDGSFGVDRMLSPPSSFVGSLRPQVGIDAGGTATAVWQRNLGGTGVVEAARFSKAGTVGRVVELSEPEKTAPKPQVAVQPGGTALVVFVQGSPDPDEETRRYRVARFVPSPTPHPPVPPGPTPNPPVPPTPTYECHGEPATIVGTSHDNDIVGTPKRDVIDGGPGDDRIKGLGGDDLICGRKGDDDVHGNKGDDDVLAGDGDDRAAGGAGEDALRGQANDDELVGGVNADGLAAGPGADFSRGGAGHDRIHGRAGRDRALGGRGRDGISGGGGADDLTGGGANDQIFGGPQDDFLDGDRGMNKCRGGSGENVLVRCQR